MKYRYYYKGEPLAEYCRKHKINVNTITSNINKKQKKNPELTDQEAVDLVMLGVGKSVKYFYRGILLADYCRSNNIDYSQVMSKIRTLKEHNPKLNNNELVRVALEDYQISQTIYYYENISLVEYCKLHPTIKYSSVLNSIKRTKRKYPDRKEKDIIKEYIEKEHKKPKRFFIDGKPLKEYCEKNRINYTTIITNLSAYRKNDKYKNLSDEEMLQLILKKYKKSETLYFYKGVSLFEYCKYNNCSYNSVYNYVQEKIKSDSSISIEEAIEEAVTSIKRFGIIYYYKGKPLVTYCRNNDLNVSYIRDTTKRKKDKYGDTKTLDEIIEETVKEYEWKKYLKEVNQIFSELKYRQMEYEEVAKICDTLKINLTNVEKLVNMGYSLKTAINMIWYFFDREDNGIKEISHQKVIDIINFIDSINRNEFEFNLFVMFALYKCGLLDTRSIILANEVRYFNSNIDSLMISRINHYQYEDLVSEQKTILMNFLEKCNINVPGQMIKCMDLTMKWSLKNYYRKNYKKVISLDETIYDSDSQTLLDVYKPKTIEQNEYSEEMKKILLSLQNEYLEFITLRYQECYEEEELCAYYNCGIDEIREKEKNILSYLKEQTYIQKRYSKRKKYSIKSQNYEK